MNLEHERFLVMLRSIRHMQKQQLDLAQEFEEQMENKNDKEKEAEAEYKKSN